MNIKKVLLFAIVLLLNSKIAYSKITVNNLYGPDKIELKFKSCNKSYYAKDDSNKSPFSLKEGKNEIELFEDGDCKFLNGEKFFARVMSETNNHPNAISNSIKAEDDAEYDLLVEKQSLKLKKK